MQYTNVQMIYYTANTGVEEPKCDQLGLDEEFERQVEHFSRVVKHVYDHRADYKISKADTTLKIFVAPEFYFRHPHGLKNGVDHFYDNQLVKLFVVLKERLGFLNKKHWIVIPGSMIWRFHSKTGQGAVMNSVLLVDFGNDSVIHSDKQKFAVQDHVLNDINGAANGVVAQHAANYQSSFLYQIHGLSIGVEICLDHSNGVLKAKMDAMNERLDIHVLIACGMDLVETKCAAKDIGLVFRCNGNGYNRTQPEAVGPAVDTNDNTIRSDVYGKGLGAAHWRRDPSVQTWVNETLPEDLRSRPWRNSKDNESDGVGVSHVYDIVATKRDWVT